ncbi:phosphoethanolamine transferase [Xenorhabdus sp. KK7.4]|uniref:phosphoethanolamine transferase n=2 Tax=Xenorhabdus sp. KK7.4 TaxID=1851572 RepID=UPI000C047195|nr:phosphoethanolamine transferase [Xenorhabdus sp. KK7.4]PHM58632.1 tRNA modification GTPase TrmE [Xenorhabdus sp. KK7.4]
MSDYFNKYISCFFMEIKKSNKEKFVPIVLIFIFSCLVNYSLGYSFRLFYSILLSFLLVIFNEFKLIYKLAIIFLISLSAVYFPVGLIYGPPSLNSIISLYYTNENESFEFISAIPIYYFISSLFVMFFGWLCFNLSLKIENKRVFLFFCFFVFFSIFFNPIKTFIIEKRLDLLSIRFTPIRFFCEIYSSNVEVKKQYEEQNRLLSLADDWQPSIQENKYNTYIVVIGESARKDMMNSYGFSLGNTPFMSHANGVLFKNYISAASSTVQSLTNSFSLREHGELKVNNNIVSLANKSGYYTYWLSNQGMLGEHDSGVSAIGQKADSYFFSNKGEYGYVKLSDDSLLPKIVDALNDNKNRKIIFVHLMGSHTNFCERTNGKYDNFYLNKDISCYIQSIKNTDKLLSKIVDEANKAKKKWSMMYFSDHGVSFYNGKLKDQKLTHGDKYKQNYQVPFFITSYDSKSRIYIDALRSGFDFLSIYSEWIGIHESRIKSDCKYISNDICNNEVKVFEFNYKVIDYNSLSDNKLGD